MDSILDLRLLLIQAEAVHGEFECTVLGGEYDQDWPAWYAEWLIAHNLNNLLPRPVAADELALLLTQYNAAYQHSDHAVHWSQFYAERLSTLPPQ